MQCDLLIKNGTIVDGTGRGSFQGDIAVKDGRINAIASIGNKIGDSWESAQVIDAGNMTVCPGFIDIHSHGDFLLPIKEHPTRLACLLEQGITTIVGGNCGFSPAPLAKDSKYLDFVQRDFELWSGKPIDIGWASMGSYFSNLEESGLSLNLAQLTGHGTLRKSLWGTDYSLPNQEKMRQMNQIIEESFAEGAYGLSLGLGYEPGMYVAMKELEEIALLVKRHDRLLTVHIKAFSRVSGAYQSSFLEKPHNIRAIEEMIELSERTGVKIQISHLLFIGRESWSSCDLALGMIDQARSRGIDIAFDVYPYHAGNTTVDIMLSEEFLKNPEESYRSSPLRMQMSEIWDMSRQINGTGMEDVQLLRGSHAELEQYEGIFLPEIGRRMNCSSNDAYLRIAEMSRGNAACLFYSNNGEENNKEVLIKIMKHPLCTFATDALITTGGMQNPAAFGAFPAVIQRYHKDNKIFPLEEAIAKMTGRSAERIGIKDRGILKPGCWADITLFDYNRMRDNTTLSNSSAKPSGVKYVFINGREVVREGSAIPGIKYGQILKCS
jgi:N-acyl-D-amino-acid deacylase